MRILRHAPSASRQCVGPSLRTGLASVYAALGVVLYPHGSPTFRSIHASYLHMNDLKHVYCVATSESGRPILLPIFTLYFTSRSPESRVASRCRLTLSLLTSDTAHRAPPGRVILLPLLHLALECHDVHNATHHHLDLRLVIGPRCLKRCLRGRIVRPPGRPEGDLPRARRRCRGRAGG